MGIIAVPKQGYTPLMNVTMRYRCFEIAIKSDSTVKKEEQVIVEFLHRDEGVGHGTENSDVHDEDLFLRLGQAKILKELLLNCHKLIVVLLDLEHGENPIAMIRDLTTPPIERRLHARNAKR
jgi:hypothetical protein